MKVPEFDKHLKKAGGHISRNVVELTIKMKTLNNKNHQASSQKFRQLYLLCNDLVFKFCRLCKKHLIQWNTQQFLNEFEIRVLINII